MFCGGTSNSGGGRSRCWGVRCVVLASPSVEEFVVGCQFVPNSKVLCLCACAFLVVGFCCVFTMFVLSGRLLFVEVCCAGLTFALASCLFPLGCFSVSVCSHLRLLSFKGCSRSIFALALAQPLLSLNGYCRFMVGFDQFCLWLNGCAH